MRRGREGGKEGEGRRGEGEGEEEGGREGREERKGKGGRGSWKDGTRMKWRKKLQVTCTRITRVQLVNTCSTAWQTG